MNLARDGVLPAFLTCLGMLLMTFNPSARAGDIETRVDALFAPWDSPDAPGCALAVVQNGELVLARGYGMADIEHAVPITPRTRFDIASVGKQFTAFAIARLAEQGTLSIDDDYRTYLPEMPDFGKTIAIGHLVHHTSGIRDYFALLAMTGVRPGDDSITQDDVLNVLRHQRELNFEPGDEYLYSNSGYVLLAAIVERVTGQSFHDWISENIFTPLEMTSSEIGDDYARIVPDRAEPYAPAGRGFRLARTNYSVYGPGLTYSTVEDMARWVAQLGHPKDDATATIARMFEQGTLNNGESIAYAFGLNAGTHRDRRVVDHSGSWSGYRTFLAWFPDHDLGVVVLSNHTSFDAVGMGRKLADLYLSEPEATGEDSATDGAEDPGGASRRSTAAQAPDAEPDANLDTFAGQYRSPELQTTFALSVEDDRLVASHPRHGEIPLKPEGQDRFALQARGLDGQIHFERDENDRVTALRITNARTRNVLFERLD